MAENGGITWSDFGNWHTEKLRGQSAALRLETEIMTRWEGAIVLICQEEITLWWKLLIASHPPPIILCDFRGGTEAVPSINMLWVYFGCFKNSLISLWGSVWWNRWTICRSVHPYTICRRSKVIFYLKNQLSLLFLIFKLWRKRKILTNEPLTIRENLQNFVYRQEKSLPRPTRPAIQQLSS